MLYLAKINACDKRLICRVIYKQEGGIKFNVDYYLRTLVNKIIVSRKGQGAPETCMSDFCSY